MTDLKKLPFPPMGVTERGKWFLGVDGEITFVVRVDDKSKSGAANPAQFAKIYDRYFADLVDKEAALKFWKFYLENMTSKYDEEAEEPDLPFPKIYKSPNAKWIYQDGQVVYKIGSKKGIASVEEFAEIYEKLKD